jgi:hypothetical protein
MDLCGIEDFAASISSISQHESRKSERAVSTNEKVLAYWLEMGYWEAFPAALAMLALLILALSLPLHFPADSVETTAGVMAETSALLRMPVFWLLFSVAAVYAVCEGLFSNWAVIFLPEDKQISPKEAGAALSAFWAALALGRLVTSWLVSRLPANGVWLLMAGAFLLLPAVNSSISGIAAYSFAGLACSSFFPLTVGRASSRFPQQAALMLGVGLGSFALGALPAMLPLTMIFRMAALLPALAAGLGILTLLGRRNEFTPAPCEVNLNNFRLTAHEGIVICPACGGENPADAVFLRQPRMSQGFGRIQICAGLCSGF